MEVYRIKLEAKGDVYSLQLQINDTTNDFSIIFLDFSKDEISFNTLSQFEIKHPQAVISKSISNSVYQEISRRGKIRAVINKKAGSFYFDNASSYVWKEEPMRDKSLPLVDCIVMEKIDERDAKLKILLNYSGTSVHVNGNAGCFIQNNFVNWEGVYSLKDKIHVRCILQSQDRLEEYLIPAGLLAGSSELVMVKNISDYRKPEKPKSSNQEVPSEVNMTDKTSPEPRNRNKDITYRIDEINNLKKDLENTKKENKNKQEEIDKLISQKAALEKDNENLKSRIQDYIGSQKKFADAIEREKAFNTIIEELTPYKEFYEKYAENKRIEQVNSDFEVLSKHAQKIETLYQSHSTPLDRNLAEIFKAFTELNRILIFEVDTNENILDKIASYDSLFKASLDNFRELLRGINQSIIDSCKSEEGFLLKDIPTKVFDGLSNPTRKTLTEKFYHSFLDLDISFNKFTESGWNTLLVVLENLRKLVNIK